MPAIGFSFFMMGMMFGAGYVYSTFLFSTSTASANKFVLTTEEFEKLKGKLFDKDNKDLPPSYGNMDPLLEL